MAKKKTAKEQSEKFFDELKKPVNERSRPKGMKIVNSGAGYWSFENDPIFQGHFVRKFTAPKDLGKGKAKKGDVIGFVMVEKDTDVEHIISNSYSINKALEEDGFKVETEWWIEFQGKGKAGNNPFNKFLIGKL